MFAIVAAVIFLLNGLHVLEDSEEVAWLLVGLASLALHFAWNPLVINLPTFRNRE